MLRKRLRLIAVVGIAVMVAISGTVGWAYWRVDKLQQESSIASDLNAGLSDLQFLTTEYLITRTSRALRQWENRHRSLGEILKQANVKSEETLLLLPEIVTRHEVLGSLFKKLVRLKSGFLTEGRAKAAERAVVTRLLTQILALSSLRDRLVEGYDRRERDLQKFVVMILAAVLLVGAVAMISLYVRVLSRLTEQVWSLSEAIKQLGDGKLDQPIATAGDPDFAPLFSALEQTRVRLAGALHQVEQERADLDHFVYIASHDFKAPLRGIDNLATWIEEDVGDQLNDDARQHLVLLRRRVARLEALLADLLSYSRAGRVKVEAETVDVGGLVRGILDDLNLRPGIRVEIADEMPIIYSPRAPLAHVFFNLISNAAKHHDREEGVIKVSGDGCVFRVSDDGPGIPARFRERIFEMFQTLKPRDEIEGSGMGLAIAKRLVTGYNGEISAYDSEGRGATFEFTWYPTGVMHDDSVPQ